MSASDPQAPGTGAGDPVQPEAKTPSTIPTERQEGVQPGIEADMQDQPVFIRP
jgi:hypothetical protein